MWWRAADQLHALGRATARLANRRQFAHGPELVGRWRQGLPDDERADRGDERVRRVRADRGLNGEPVEIIELLWKLGLVERHLTLPSSANRCTVASW